MNKTNNLSINSNIFSNIFLMTDNERIIEVIKYCNEQGLCDNNRHSFSQFIGLKNAQQLYDIKKKRYGISKELAGIITTKCLNINTSWLLTGKENMLNDSPPLKSIESNIMFTKSGEMENVVKVFLETINQKTEEIIRLNKKIVLLESELKRLGGSTKNEQPGENPGQILSG